MVLGSGHEYDRAAEPALRISDRRLDDLADIVIVERLHHDNSRTADQRRVDLEERILGGGADEHDETVLDGVQ